MIDQDRCTNATDEELVQLTLENREYIVCLMDRYSDKLTRYIRRISNVSPEEAEDILQETFIKAYQKLNDFDTTLSFSSWIYRIAHNETISSFRKRKVRPHGNSIDVEPEVIEQIADNFDIPRDVDRKILREQINEVLDKMDIKYREVLVLRFFQDKSYEEISDIIRKPKGTVATLLNRAKKQFKKYNTI